MTLIAERFSDSSLDSGAGVKRGQLTEEDYATNLNILAIGMTCFTCFTGLELMAASFGTRLSTPQNFACMPSRSGLAC